MLSLKSSEARGQARVDVDEKKDGWSNCILIHGEIDSLCNWRHFLIKTILSENACPLLSKQGSEGIISSVGPVSFIIIFKIAHGNFIIQQHKFTFPICVISAISWEENITEKCLADAELYRKLYLRREHGQIKIFYWKQT